MMILTGNDSDCFIYEDLPFGDYYYSQAVTTGVLQSVLKYSDQFDMPVNNIFDFFDYDPKIFNSNVEDDDKRERNADGLVNLNPTHSAQTIVILNGF